MNYYRIRFYHRPKFDPHKTLFENAFQPLLLLKTGSRMTIIVLLPVLLYCFIELPPVGIFSFILLGEEAARSW